MDVQASARQDSQLNVRSRKWQGFPRKYSESQVSAHFVEKVGFGAGLRNFRPLQGQRKISGRRSAKIAFCRSQNACLPLTRKYPGLSQLVWFWRKNAAFDFPTFSTRYAHFVEKFEMGSSWFFVKTE
ncbi:MAG: hypothetical protein WBO29_12525 [Albidovulum sp.]